MDAQMCEHPHAALLPPHQVPGVAPLRAPPRRRPALPGGGPPHTHTSTCIHTHAHAHAYTRTRIHTHTHTQHTHARTHAPQRAPPHRRPALRGCGPPHTHMHTQTHTNPHATHTPTRNTHTPARTHCSERLLIGVQHCGAVSHQGHLKPPACDQVQEQRSALLDLGVRECVHMHGCARVCMGVCVTRSRSSAAPSLTWGRKGGRACTCACMLVEVCLCVCACGCVCMHPSASVRLHTLARLDAHACSPRYQHTTPPPLLPCCQPAHLCQPGYTRVLLLASLQLTLPRAAPLLLLLVPELVPLRPLWEVGHRSRCGLSTYVAQPHARSAPAPCAVILGARVGVCVGVAVSRTASAQAIL